MIARKHPGDQLQDIAPSTTFYMKIPYKWYLFRKLEYSAIGFKNEIGDYIIKRPLVLDINRPDLYGGPCKLLLSSIEEKSVKNQWNAWLAKKGVKNWKFFGHIYFLRLEFQKESLK